MRARLQEGYHAAPPPDRGMVLLLCLLFLVVLTLLGLSASTETVLQNRLAANLQESVRAKQSALLASAWAERWLLSLEGPAPATCVQSCTGLILHAAGGLPPHPEHESFDWWLANGHEAGVDPMTGQRSEFITADSFDAPAWVIETARTITPEESGEPDLQVWYRILARGTGQLENSVSVIESVVVRYWPASADEGSFSVVAGACPGSSATAICGRFSWREIL